MLLPPRRWIRIRALALAARPNSGYSATSLTSPGRNMVAKFSDRQAVQVISDPGGVDPTPPEEFLGRSGTVVSIAELAGQVRYYVVFDDDHSLDYVAEQWLVAKP